MDVGLNGSSSGVLVLKKAGQKGQSLPSVTRTRLRANAVVFTPLLSPSGRFHISRRNPERGHRGPVDVAKAVTHRRDPWLRVSPRGAQAFVGALQSRVSCCLDVAVGCGFVVALVSPDPGVWAERHLSCPWNPRPAGW